MAGKQQVSAAAILDDFNLVGKAPHIFEAFDDLARSARGAGLHLKRDKCKVLWPHIGATTVTGGGVR